MMIMMVFLVVAGCGAFMNLVSDTPFVLHGLDVLHDAGVGVTDASDVACRQCRIPSHGCSQYHGLQQWFEAYPLGKEVQLTSNPCRPTWLGLI
jgi:hypothetical protein